MLSCLDIVKNACLSVTQDSYHYEAAEKLDKYCVWAEERESGNLDSDNKKASP